MLLEPLWLDKHMVAFKAAAHPRRKRLLRGKVSGNNRPVLWREDKASVERADRKLRRKQRRILGADAKHHQRAGVTDNSCPHPIGELRGELISGSKKGGEFSCLAE